MMQRLVELKQTKLFDQAKQLLTEHIEAMKKIGSPLEDSLAEYLELNVFYLTADDDT